MPPEINKKRTSLWRSLVELALVSVAAWLFFSQAWIPIRVSGRSMEPAYHHGGFNFINRLAYWQKAPARGDVVGVAFTGHRLMLLKRIIGLPGERVKIRDGLIEINDASLDEIYIQTNRQPWNTQSVNLADNEYFIVGDNRATSQAEHVFGTVEGRRIVGKILW